MEPQYIGEYRLIAQLGRGGMSDVFLAVRRAQFGFSKLVVLKRLRDDLVVLQPADAEAGSDNHSFSQLLLDEARVCARLHHPNIVQTFEAGVEADGQLPFLAMEYLDGQSLDHVLGMASRERARLPVPIILRIVCDVLSALEYAHTLRDYDGTPIGIVHRDVSPHNIFLTYQGEVKLVDFGVAKHVWCSDQTATGIVKGKLTYMAPEQARSASEHKDVDQRADLFALGIVLWESLAMRRLLAADSPAATLSKLLHEPIPLLTSVRPDAHPVLSEICSRALEREPEARYPSAAAMRADLEQHSGVRAATHGELANFVRQLFQRERAERSQQLQAALASEDIVLSPPESTSTRKLSVGPRRRSVTGQTPISVAAPRNHDPSSSAGMVLGVMAACVLLGCVLWAKQLTPPTPTPASQPTAAAAGATPAAVSGMEAEAVLRLCGSNTIGAELAPALVEAFLSDKGATQVTRHRGAHTDLTAVSASLDNKRLTIDIAANGSATAFTGLQAGTCDIGMASRAIEDAEVDALKERGLGDMRLPGAEHVIALDGIAVIVHPNNPVRALDRETLHSIFTGKIASWSAVGGADAPIHLLSRDGKSGTFDTFRHLVMGKDALSPEASLFGQNDVLADQVASDPDAIGFVGLAYVRAARALAVSEPGAPPMLPTQFTVATEGYMLSRRLYLYTLPKQRTAWIPEFLSFALSQRAHQVSAQNGFVDLSVLTSPNGCSGHCSKEYAASIAGAERTSVDFRFRRASNDLDSRAQRDLDRLVAFMRDHPHAKLRLLGFADANGGPVTNWRLSFERARTVAAELAMRGVPAAMIRGLGSQMPVASNETDAGKQRNRRVEAWVDLNDQGKSPL